MFPKNPENHTVVKYYFIQDKSAQGIDYGCVSMQLEWFKE